MKDAVDDINPALPIIRNIYHNSHCLGSLRSSTVLYMKLQNLVLSRRLDLNALGSKLKRTPLSAKKHRAKDPM